MVAIKKKKSAASRASRHTKKYMRKGTDVANFEEVLKQANLPDGSVEKTPVEELFFEDRQPMTETPKKFTKRQQAKLDKISKFPIDLENDTDGLPTFPKAPSKKGLKRLRQPVARSEPIKSKKPRTAGKYDLWDSDFVPKINLENKKASEHILRDTKKKIPNKPETLRMKSSLLRAVALPGPGASYNPSADDYKEYVEKIAIEEQEFIDEEDRLSRKLKPKEEKMVTEEERMLEASEGLVIDPRYNETNEEETAVTDHEEAPEKNVINSENRKTKKERKQEAKNKKEELQLKLKKAKRLNENEVFKAKSINKQLAKKEAEQAKALSERKVKKLTEKLTTRQKLGRGKFEEEETPFLLEEELPDNLRQLKPQGNILTDRIKSLQKRNILPIGGAREKMKKSKLRRKFVEKRTVQEVKKGSRVI